MCVCVCVCGHIIDVVLVGAQSNRDSTDPSVEHIAAHSQWVRCVIRRGDTLFSCSRYLSGVVGIAYDEQPD